MTRLPPRARPTLYQGFQMRSRLEATVAEWLDAHGLVWKYEGPAYGHEAWRCPTCDHRGFDPISPWVSPQYRRYQGLTGQSDEQ